MQMCFSPDEGNKRSNALLHNACQVIAGCIELPYFSNVVATVAEEG